MEERNIAFIIGMVVGGFVLAVVALIQKVKKEKAWCEYDERQLQARGKAFQYGFVVLLFYDVFYAALFAENEPSWCNNMFGIFLGVGIALVIMGGYAIWNDAFMQLNQTPLAVYLIFGGVGGMNLIAAIGHIWTGEFLENGKIGDSGINLVLGVTMLILTITFAVKNHLDKREEE